MMNEQGLLQLKDDIVGAKTQLVSLEGRQDTLLEQLQEKWKVKTPAEAQKKLQKMQKQIDTLDEEIQTATEELEEQLEQDE